MKLSLVMIVKDAEKTIEACLASVLPYVNEVVIGFGGKSSDRTESMVIDIRDRFNSHFNEATNGDAQPFRTLQIDWKDDFAAARNEAWSRVSPDTDWAIWLDSDDILLGGERLREVLEGIGDEPTNCLLVPYHYDIDEQGNASCNLYRERVVRAPWLWRWKGAVHEILSLDDDVPWFPRPVQDVVVKHNPERNKAKGDRNLDILYRELERTEPKPDLRTLFYLGRENATRGRTDEALRYFQRYITTTEYSEEAYQVAVMMGNLLRAAGRFDDARARLMQAIQIAPHWPDAFYMLARVAYDQHAWPEVISWTRAGATHDAPVTSLIVDPRDYEYWPIYYLGLAQAQLGQTQEAVDTLFRLVNEQSDDQLLAIVRALRDEVEAKDAFNALMTLYQYLGRHDEWLKVRMLLRRAVPKALEQNPEIQGLWRRVSQMTAHVENPQVMVDFYTGNPGWFPLPDDLVLNEAWGGTQRLAFARKSLCGPPRTVLDMGSSDGFVSLPLARDGYVVLGYDLDPRCVAEANRRAYEWGFSAEYLTGSVDDIPDGAHFEVALAFEILEHLVDPGAFLDELEKHSDKIVITTPYLSWEGGHFRDWDKLELKGHIRIFDLDDIERLLSSRGQIVDLYREKFSGGPSEWIFASYYPRRQTGKSITFVTGNALERWSPRKLDEEGLGGSETAVVMLGKELAAQGWSVSSYGSYDRPGYYDGVRYRPMESFTPEVSQDALVAWRAPEVADLPLRAKRLILWMHDTDVGDRLTPVRAAAFDRIVVLSEWHREHMLARYPFLDADKLVIVGNGVDPERFEHKVPLIKADASAHDVWTSPTVDRRQPHRVVYTSSPDRGLDVILEHIWPSVVEAVPDAELHVYYGWNNFEALRNARPDLAEFQRRVADLTLATRNVVNHGRVTQKVLATELMKSSVWLYPTYFHETYCISAVEAQLAGVIPVTNARAALAETVRAGVIIPEGDVRTQGREYADAVIRLLTDAESREQLRAKVLENAPRLPWELVATFWETDVLGVSD